MGGQSRPNPRGSSTSSWSRSTSHTASRSSAVSRVGQRLGQSIAPRLVFGLQGAQLLDGRGPAGRAGLRPRRCSLLDGDGRSSALAVSALAFRVGQTHEPIVSVTVTYPIKGVMGPSRRRSSDGVQRGLVPGAASRADGSRVGLAALGAPGRAARSRGRLSGHPCEVRPLVGAVLLVAVVVVGAVKGGRGCRGALLDGRQTRYGGGFRLALLSCKTSL